MAKFIPYAGQPWNTLPVKELQDLLSKTNRGHQNYLGIVTDQKDPILIARLPVFGDVVVPR